jgi:hypothetical protein
MSLLRVLLLLFSAAEPKNASKTLQSIIIAIVALHEKKSNAPFISDDNVLKYSKNQAYIFRG